MSFDAIGGRSSWRLRRRVAGVPNCDPIMSPAQPGRSSVAMPKAHELANAWLRDERDRLRSLPRDERLIRLPTGGQP
jgi:hypothetical protein